jgi:hypothetical protein
MYAEYSNIIRDIWSRLRLILPATSLSDKFQTCGTLFQLDIQPQSPDKSASNRKRFWSAIHCEINLKETFFWSEIHLETVPRFSGCRLPASFSPKERGIEPVEP